MASPVNSLQMQTLRLDLGHEGSESALFSDSHQTLEMKVPTQDRVSVSTWVSVRRAVWFLVHILLSHQGCGKTIIPTSIYAAAAAAVPLEYLLGLPTAI